MTESPKVSIIIRTLNEATFLPNLFDLINNQSYKNYEIIVVDSGSKDDTQKIAKEFSDKLLVIEKDDFTFGYAINHGIKHSNGELVCIVSAHTKPNSNNWLEELVSAFNYEQLGNSKVAMSYGKQIGGENSNFSEIMDFNYLFGKKELKKSSPKYFCNNANSMIRKDLWLNHPFNETLSGLEDIEWSKYWMDKGYKIVYKPNASIIHIHNETGPQIRNRFWRESIAARSIGIFPLKTIIFQVPIQLFLIFKDIFFLFKNKSKGKIKDILRYRFNRLFGTLKSITNEKFNLKDFSENYNYLSYKVVEYEKKNSPVLKEYKLEPLSPNEVLIKTSYVGICETDFEVLKGDLDYYKSGWAKYPIVPGHEFSGIISRIGAKVKNLNEGDNVVGQCILSCNKCEMCLSSRETACSERKEVGVLNYNGAYSEYVVLASRFVHKIPSNLSLLSASSIEPLAVVLKGLNRVGLDNQVISDKESVLIIGSGPIGHLVARVGHHWGHKVTILDTNQKRLNFLDDIKIEKKSTIEDYLKYSYIVECTGNADIAEKLIKESEISSTILLLGLPYNKKLIDLEDLVSSDKKIVGAVGSNSKNFKDAITIAPKLNLKNFDQCVHGFKEWKFAWNDHKSKKHLKVKLKLDS
jgi:D-arabinose 1-dehydrogenase-like Zn-dependent alcohol dehydrogenase/GT2 family glycosyltransferase